jgi:hypothetical protein
MMKTTLASTIHIFTALYLLYSSIATAALPTDAMITEPPRFNAEQNEPLTLSEQDMLEAIEQLDNDLIEQLTVSDTAIDNDSMPSTEPLLEQNALMDDFGDVDLTELLPLTATESLDNSEFEQMASGLATEVKAAKAMAEQTGELEHSINAPMADDVVSGVGVIGKEEALLNQLDDSNLMDYQTDDDFWLPKADIIDPPLNFNE